MKKDGLFITKSTFGDGYSVTKTIFPNHRATFAIEMMVRIALASGETSGEDSAGRAKLELMSAKEVVQRACDIADNAFSEFEKRGWLIDVPGPELLTKQEDPHV